MNGALARVAHRRDRIFILSFAFTTPEELRDRRLLVARFGMKKTASLKRFEGEILREE